MPLLQVGNVNMLDILKGVGDVAAGLLKWFWASFKRFSLAAAIKVFIGFGVWAILGLFFGPIVAKVWTAMVRIYLVYFTYRFWSDWLMFELRPILINALNMLPSPYLTVFDHIWEAIKATNTFLPWEETLVVIKWLILVRLFILSFHLVEYVWAKLREFIMFLTA